MSERDALQQEVERLRHHLSNLLARIHRDGGHYEQAVGTDRAVQDADTRVAQLNADSDEVVKLIEEMQDARAFLAHLKTPTKTP